MTTRIATEWRQACGMDNGLFVSRYQLELPSKEVLQQQIEAERRKLEEEPEAMQG